MALSDSLNTYARSIRIVSILAIVLAVFLLMGALPVDRGLEAIKGWVAGLGVWGPAVFAGIYVVAAVLMLPGSVLTLAAGALFGVLEGTISVSIGSTTGAALAFLIGRYVARKRVAAMAAEHPKFEAIDRAVGQEGWKIVALLRLSPFVPFNLQNYFYGITSIRFWPCVLASWIAMLPGTLMYVYLGSAAEKAVGAAAGVDTGRTPAEWALFGVGLLATIVVTIYVTRLAVRAVRRQTDIAPDEQAETRIRAKPTGTPWGVVITALVAVLVLGSAVFGRDALGRLVDGLFGPPQVTMTEAYADTPRTDAGPETETETGAGSEPEPETAPTVDHALLDTLLKKHVDANGLVDYAGLNRDRRDLQRYLALVEKTPFEPLGRDEKLTLLINAYNAFTLDLILANWQDGKLKSIRDIKDPWDQPVCKVAGLTISLNQLEHEQIRPKFKEPRIHFALVCAAIGCPRLRNEAYVAKRLETQLADQMTWCHARDRWFAFDKERNVVSLTQLYKWYGGDFEQDAGSVLDFVSRYSSALDSARRSGARPKIEWLDYDWGLNRQPSSGS